MFACDGLYLEDGSGYHRFLLAKVPGMNLVQVIFYFIFLYIDKHKMFSDVGLVLIFFFYVFLMWIRWNWNVNKFKKSDNIKKFHKSYIIRLFLFFQRFFFFLHYFDCRNIIIEILH